MHTRRRPPAPTTRYSIPIASLPRYGRALVYVGLVIFLAVLAVFGLTAVALMAVCAAILAGFTLLGRGLERLERRYNAWDFKRRYGMTFAQARALRNAGEIVLPKLF